MIYTGLVWVLRTAAVTCCTETQQEPTGNPSQSSDQTTDPRPLFLYPNLSPYTLFLLPTFEKPIIAFALGPRDRSLLRVPVIQVSSAKDGKHFEPDVGSAWSELNLGFLMTISFLSAFLWSQPWAYASIWNCTALTGCIDYKTRKSGLVCSPCITQATGIP